MKADGKTREPSFAAQVAPSLAAFLRELGFKRRGVRFHRLRNRIWQTIGFSSLSKSPFPATACGISLEVAAVVTREVMGAYGAQPGKRLTSEQNPPAFGDWDFEMSVAPNRNERGHPSGWVWEPDLTVILAEMRGRIAAEAGPFFDGLSSDAQLLARFRAVCPEQPQRYAVLLALDRDIAAVQRACIAIRRRCIRIEKEMPTDLLKLIKRKGLEERFKMDCDWRGQVRLVHEFLERNEPAYKMDPGVLTDEYYQALPENEERQPDPLSKESIQQMLRLHGNPTLTIDGVTYSRAELQAMIRERESID